MFGEARIRSVHATAQRRVRIPDVLPGAPNIESESTRINDFGEQRSLSHPLGNSSLPATLSTERDEVDICVAHGVERLFHDASFGFRPGRNCHGALAKVIELHEQGYRVVLDADIKAFFDQLPHSTIKEAVAAQVADGNILNLIEKFLRAGVMENGVF